MNLSFENKNRRAFFLSGANNNMSLHTTLLSRKSFMERHLALQIMLAIVKCNYKTISGDIHMSNMDLTFIPNRIKFTEFPRKNRHFGEKEMFRREKIATFNRKCYDYCKKKTKYLRYSQEHVQRTILRFLKDGLTRCKKNNIKKL